jgi:Tfp pilus assembly protein FimT
MIELMLVVMILLLTTLIAVPSFVRSFRGARLRTSARYVVMTHRHARALAVLNQTHVAILFDTEREQLRVAVSSSSRGRSSMSRFLDQSAPAGEQGSVSVVTESIRHLAPKIEIEDFRVGETEQEIDGIYYVNYYPNGGCDEFSLKLADERGRRVRISVDPHSGHIETRDG